MGKKARTHGMNLHQTEDVTMAASVKPVKKKRVTAETLAAKQKDISVSEFFTKNRHLLGFDNPRKALLTTVKEAVDNALDACEEAGILPHIQVSIARVAERRPGNGGAPAPSAADGAAPMPLFEAAPE